jgi:hypothetical protein
MHLDGRGIALVPSVFVGKDPELYWNPNDSGDLPRLILPAAYDGTGHARLRNGTRAPKQRWPR